MSNCLDLKPKQWTSRHLLFFLFILFMLDACQPPNPIFLCCYEKPVALNLPFKEVEGLFPGKLKIERNYWGRPASGHVYSFNEKENLDVFDVEHMLSFKFRKGRLCFFANTTYLLGNDSLQALQFDKLIGNRFQEQLPVMQIDTVQPGGMARYSYHSDSLIYELIFKISGLNALSNSPSYYVFRAFLPQCRPVDE